MSTRKNIGLFFCLLIILCPGKVYQQSQPTHEQTIDFLNNKINGNDWLQILYKTNSNDLFDNIVDYQGIQVEFKPCEFNFHFRINKIWNGGNNFSENWHSNKVDISKVSEIRVIEVLMPEDSDFRGLKAVGLAFISSSGQANPPWEKLLPVGYIKESEIFEEDQLFKALQHLRKLCGAPEPIRFD